MLAIGGSTWIPAGAAGRGRVLLASPSARLVRDLQHLFLRFGINAAVRAPIVAANDSAWVSHELEISGGDDLAAPRATRSGCSASRPRSRSWSPTRRPRRSGCSSGAGPPGRARRVGRAGGRRALGRDRGHRAEGDEQVYDLTIPELHNFVAGDVFVHNTSFALGMVAHAALEANRPVLFFSLEMSNLELSQRLLCAEARVDSQRVRNGQLQADDWSKISRAMGRLAEAPIWIDDNPNLTIMEIRAKARRLKSQIGDLGMIVIDYLQLMTGRSGAESRQVEVSELSRGLKILARELETPVVALSQLSRGLEMRADKRPMLADLRESGSIEQDSDVVMFIYREEIYDPKPENAGQAEIIVAKHRSGPTGVAHLAFLPQYTRFANMARGLRLAQSADAVRDSGPGRGSRTGRSRSRSGGGSGTQAIAGNVYRTPAGRIEVTAVDIVGPGEITDADARGERLPVGGGARGRPARRPRPAHLPDPLPPGRGP